MKQISIIKLNITYDTSIMNNPICYSAHENESSYTRAEAETAKSYQNGYISGISNSKKFSYNVSFITRMRIITFGKAHNVALFNIENLSLADLSVELSVVNFKGFGFYTLENESYTLKGILGENFHSLIKPNQTDKIYVEYHELYQVNISSLLSKKRPNILKNITKIVNFPVNCNYDK